VVYAQFAASPYATADPGVQQYLAFMKQNAPTVDPYGYSVNGYIDMKFVLDTLKTLQTPFTQAAFITALNSTHGYTANGMSGPINFPDFHTNGQLCLSYSILKNGQWAAAANGPNPFTCGTRYSAPT
jgi:hypothetical protein